MENTANKKRKLHKGSLTFKIIAYTVLSVYLLWVLVPFFVIIVGSITPYAEIMDTMSFIWFPKQPTFQAFKTLLFDDTFAVNGVSQLIRGFFNTLWIGVLPMIFGLFISGLAAFAYAKMKFRLKNVLFTILTATAMIPGSALAMPSYLFYNILGWGSGPLPLIVPHLFGGCMTAFFLMGFFSGIPDSLFEAGKVDGMGFFQMYVRIMIPLTIPAFLAQFMFGFIGAYNNYSGPLLYLSNRPELQTLQYVLTQTPQLYEFDGGYTYRCATAVISIVPLLLIFVFCQRYFLDGIATSGLKD